jgi:hypothetical protein
LVFIGIARANLPAGNTKSAGRDPRSPACDRGQFSATVRAARGDPTAHCASACTLYGSPLALGELSAVKIDADRNAAIGGACERLHDWPVGQHIGRHIDFVLGAIDQCHVDVFKVFDRRVVNGRRGLGFACRERGEKENCGYESAQ